MHIPQSFLCFLPILNCLGRTAIDASSALRAIRIGPYRLPVFQMNDPIRTVSLTLFAMNAGIRHMERTRPINQSVCISRESGRQSAAWMIPFFCKNPLLQNSKFLIRSSQLFLIHFRCFDIVIENCIIRHDLLTCCAKRNSSFIQFFLEKTARMADIAPQV